MRNPCPANLYPSFRPDLSQSHPWEFSPITNGSNARFADDGLDGFRCSQQGSMLITICE